MSVIKAFRVVALVLVSTFVPATALAGTTDARPAKVKVAKHKTLKVQKAKAKGTKVTKVKAMKFGRNKAASR